MELTAAVAKRTMVRAFSDRPVPAEILSGIVALAARAPSAGGTEGVDLLVLSEPDARARFWAHASSPSWRETAPQAPGLLAAPVLVLVLADPLAYETRYARPDKTSSPLGGVPVERWPVPYWAVDAGFHGLLLLLGAVDNGLGALFFHVRGTTGALLGELGVPDGRALVGAVALGFPDPTRASAPRRARRAVSDVVHRERW